MKNFSDEDFLIENEYENYFIIFSEYYVRKNIEEYLIVNKIFEIDENMMEKLEKEMVCFIKRSEDNDEGCFYKMLEELLKFNGVL